MYQNVPYKRVFVTIDLDAIVFNMESMKQNIKPGTEMMGVVKADGYGHGAVPVAKAMDPYVWGYAAATSEEALQLRAHGITKPVLVLSPVHPSEFQELIREGIRITVFTREQAELFQKRYKENQSHLHVSGVMTQLLDECEAAGVKMGVITNGPFSHQVQKFHTLGLDKWFTEDQLIVSAGVGVAKPDVKIFRMAEEKWGMKPENTFMIGDSLENDIAGAKNAGWKTIWMNHHRYTVPEGMEKPDYIAYTEEELRKLIVQICFTTKKDG